VVDTSNWGGLPDVKLDNAAADLLATGCEDAASLIREQVSGRRTATTNAMRDFDGLFSEIFQQNQETANSDAEEIATALEDIAKQVRHIKSIVPAENDRRREAREWKKRRDKDKSEITLSDLGGDEDPPEGPSSPPAPQVLSANAKDRATPQPGTRSGGAGRSSARPEELKNFVTGVSGKITALDGRPGKLKGLNSDFTAGFDWGLGEPSGVDGSSVYAAFTKYNDLNVDDKTWVDTVATAFEKAGSEAPGGMKVLSNASLASSLQAAGVSVTRLDIAPTSPRLYGVKPTTGYSDDPVNASTGNFVEPETDLAFTGGCATLELTRMYNSFNRESGAFGPGWSSWTEVRLVVDDESARFTHPDGRVSQFPRLGDGWDRALGESLWLERDGQADELRVTDNDGLTWRFDRAGSPLSRDRGEGTMVSLVHEDGRLVRLEHERGRHITLAWEDDRVVAADASDGRRMDYDYDEGRLVAASGPLGTRSYRWNDAGLIGAVIDADGVVEVENAYDEQGRVTAQMSPHGRTSRYSYLPGNVTEVADPDGTRANTYVHDTRGQLVGIVDTDGHRQSYAYDEAGNLVLVTERDGSATVREYDGRGRLAREVRPSGAELQFEHDDLDRLVTVVTEEGAETRYSYDGTSRNPFLLVDAEGGETRFDWADGLLIRLVDPTGVELRYGYDEHGDLVSTTNAVGDTARLEYDDHGRVTAAITPRGNRTGFVYDGAGRLVERHDPDEAVWRFEYTAGGRRTAVVDPLGARTTIEYDSHGEEARTIDPLGRAMRRRLDDLGNLASVELPDGSTWRYSYDSLSRFTSATSPDGHTWTQSHDTAANQVQELDPLGHVTAVTANQADGSVTTSGELGSITQRFDALGRAVSAEQIDGSAVMATYDRCGRAVELLDAEGSLTRIERDPAGRPIAVTDPTGRVTRYEYDTCGRRVAEIDPTGARTTLTYNADSLPARTTMPTGEVGWIDYDTCGRITTVFTPGVGGARYRYDAAGRIVEIRDNASGSRQFSYDAAGQLVTSTNGNGGVTHYELDALGRVVSIMDPLGQVTRREFDAMNRCVAETDPLGRTTRAGYDPAGHQLWQEDPSGRRTEWAYDAAGRIVAVEVDGRPVSELTWGPRGTSVEITDHTRSDGRVVTHRCAWNRRGQVVRQSRDDETTAWQYDAAGRRTSMTMPDGSRIDYSHDESGRLATIDHPLLGRAAFEHDASGRLVSATADHLIQSWEYADAFMVAHTVANGDESLRTDVRRDEQGRVLSLDRDGVTTTFEHDAANQLVESRTGGDAVRWRYDASGRIVTESRAHGSREFTYDAGGQLLSVEGPEGTTQHTYDEVGRRVRTQFADGRTRDLEWSPTGWLASIVDEAAGQSVRTHLHVDALGQLASVDDVPVYWDSADSYAPSLVQVGATPVVAAGGLTGVGDHWSAPGWRTSRTHGTDLWSVAQGTMSMQPGMPVNVRVSPAGELTIGGLEWLGARVYDASSRGFLSVDPLDPVTGAGWAGNPYSYAGNDPLHALDPTGLKPVSEADLKAANAPWYEKTWDFVKENKDWIIGGALVIGGGVLMATGVGGPAGAMLLSAGADTLIQKATTGEVNYKQVAVAGAAGGLGAGAGMLTKGMTGASKVMATAGTEIVIGTAQGGANYMVGDGPHTVGGFFKASGEGALTSTISAGTAAKYDPLSDIAGNSAARRMGAIIPEGSTADVMDLTNKQILAKNGAEMAVDAYGRGQANLINTAITEGEVDGSDLTLKTLIDTGAGGIKNTTGDFGEIRSTNRAARREVEQQEYTGLFD